MAVSVLTLAVLGPIGLGLFHHVEAKAAVRPLPNAAQVIDQKSFLVLDNIPAPKEFLATKVSHAIPAVI